MHSANHVMKTQLQQHESLVTKSTTLKANLNSDLKALDAGSVITESSETKSDMHDTSNSSRTYITHVVDANIRPHLLKAELVKSKEIVEKETYNELSRRDARKMTQDPKPGFLVIKGYGSTSAHCTPYACTPNLDTLYMSSPVSMCSGGMSNDSSCIFLMRMFNLMNGVGDLVWADTDWKGKPSLRATELFWNTLTYDAKTGVYITSLPEITPFISLQLRVARLEQEMSEVKKTDHSADVLASIKSQVPTVVDKYLGTKLDDALLKILERHTADLIEKYSALPGLESIKNQESEKSPKEIIIIKREQGERNRFITYSSGQQGQDAYEIWKLQSRVKTTERACSVMMKKTDDDDEGPSAGIKPDSAPWKDDTKVQRMKPRESDASASIQTSCYYLNWMADTRDDVVNSLMHMLPNNIQITNSSLMHMLNLNPSPHKEDSLESKIMSNDNHGTEAQIEGTGKILGFLMSPQSSSRAQVKGTGFQARGS
ncbi:hypothetical protein Tco_0506677 [Tanacetum coccineum]